MSSTPKKKAGRLPPPDWADDIIDQVCWAGRFMHAMLPAAPLPA
jgi:hypothetical protein